jgi:hypothetical protein
MKGTIQMLIEEIFPKLLKREINFDQNVTFSDSGQNCKSLITTLKHIQNLKSLM